jgi:DNA mismatch repair protein MutS
METIGLDRGLERQARHARPKEATTADESRTAPANFHSILFETPPADISGDTVQPPPFFSDLNLDQIVDAITAGREEYRLKPFFYTRLNRLTEIAYRQEVMRDLEHEPLFAGVQSFSERMRTMRHHLAAAKNWPYKFSRERWFLDAVETYCAAVGELRRLLEQTHPASRGLRAAREYLSQYIESDRQSLREKLAEERRQFDLFREELQVLARKWSAEALNQSLLKLQPCQDALQEKMAVELQVRFPRWLSRLPPLLRAWCAWLVQCCGEFRRANGLFAV